MSESLKHKTFKRVGWSFADNISSSGVSFLVGLAFTRLLTPAEYGIMATITIFITISNSIIDSGFPNALIRRTDMKRIDYNIVFFFNLVVGIIPYVLPYFCTPSTSSFFNEPILIPVTRVIGLVLIINSLGIIQRTIMVQEIDFRTQTKISLIASLSNGGIDIVVAFYGHGVWSLVGQQVSRQLLNTVFLWLYSAWRPVCEFSADSFKCLFGFGSKLLLSDLLDTLYKNIYYIVIGRSHSSTQSGQYTRAEQFNTTFSGNLTSVVQRVSYPVLSSIQSEPERLREAYRRVIKATILISFVCMLGLAAVAKPLILLLIGGKWLAPVSYLQIVCFTEMLYPLHAVNSNILQVKSRSDLFLKLEIVEKIIAVIPIFLGIMYGIEYMLWGSVLISFIAYLLNSYHSVGLIRYPTIDQIKDVFPTLAVSLSVAFVMWITSFLDISIYVMLPLQCFSGLLLSFLVHEKLNLGEYLEIEQLILSCVQKK